MRLASLVPVLLLSLPAEAQEEQKNGRLLLGLRGGTLPYAQEGHSPMVGVDCGVLFPGGLGLGLQGLVMPGAQVSTGLLASLRIYTDRVQPLTLYGALAAGFVSGAMLNPGACTSTSEDAPALCGPRPTANPGVGALWRGNNFYAGFEMSLFGLKTPLMSVSLGLDFELLPTPEI